jgi:hypothetical protein
MRRLRSHISYANVMATVAVFIALGGASYAALKLPKNSVGTKQLKKNAVNGAKVKNNSLTGNDIDEATLGVVPSAAQASNAQSLGGVPAAQFLGGSGRMTAIPLITRPNGNHPASLAEIPGIGKLTVHGCALNNTGFIYTNESNVTQNFVLMSAANGISNSLPQAGTVAPGKSQEYGENEPYDLMRMSFTGGDKVLEITVAQSREGAETCLYWGTVYYSG